MAKFFGLEIYKREEMNRRIDAAVKQATNAAMPQWALETAEAERFNLPDPSIYGNQATLYQKLSWVTTACTITAESAALTPFEVLRVISGKEPKDIPNHPFEMLLARPNDLDSRFEFLVATIALWMLNGNAYWWLNRTAPDAPPDELWFIPPHMIQPIPDGRMFLRGYYYYPGNGREMILEPWEILHFRRFNPFSRFVGMSAIESIAVVAGGDLAMQRYNTKFFGENNGRLASILTFEQMVEDGVWKKIKDETREAAKKREMLMLRGVGQGGVNWLQNAITQKEMEFLQGRTFNKEEIWSVLAPGLFTMLSENATEANSRTGAATFNERTVYPKHVLMAEKITNELLPCYPGRPLIGRFEDIRITDKAMELQEQEKYILVHTVNEIREEYYGDDPLDDERGDLFPAQIKPDSGTAQETQPPQQMPMNPQMPQAENIQQNADDTAEEDIPEAQQPNDSTAGKALADLARYQRKALKRIGRATDFSSNALPADLLNSIRVQLEGCKSEAAVKAVFDRARESLRPAANALDILEAMRLELAGIKAAQ